MKIAQALAAIKSLNAELQHRRSLESQKSWSYRSLETPDAELQPNFDFDANHDEIKRLSRLSNKLGQAISITNLNADVQGLDEKDLKELDEWV